MRPNGNRLWRPSSPDFFPFRECRRELGEQLCLQKDTELPEWAKNFVDAWLYRGIEKIPGGYSTAGPDGAAINVRVKSTYAPLAVMNHLGRILNYCAVSHAQKLTTMTVLVVEWMEEQ